jgi:hypothetical protein
MVWYGVVQLAVVRVDEDMDRYATASWI